MDYFSNLPRPSGGFPVPQAMPRVCDRCSALTPRMQRHFTRSSGSRAVTNRRGHPQVSSFVRSGQGRFQGRGRLDAFDAIDRNFPKRYYVDDWHLPRGIQAGQLVEVTLQSHQFDAYLYLTDTRTRCRKLLLTGLDTRTTGEGFTPDARLVFSVQPQRQYRLRVSSQTPRAQGRYKLTCRIYPASSASFNFFYGFGLVDAAAAVASALVGSPVETVPLEVRSLSNDDWGRHLVNAPALWAQQITGKGVTVAVIDTGVDRMHPDLQPNIWVNSREIAGNGLDDDQNGLVDDVQGWDFVDHDNDPSDTDGHGTHVAGLIAAAQNEMGITGVAPDATLLPIRVLSRQANPADPTGNIALIRGIDYAVQMGAQVINLSLNKGYRYEFELGAALQRANQAGAVVVIAAGNERETGGMVQPSQLAQRAMVSNLGIAVGALDFQRTMTRFSNPAGRIPGPFVVAPGSIMHSTFPAGQLGLLDGTSMATPHVSGIVALMLSANPDLTPAQVYRILTETATPQGITLTP
ncbi:MAG: S8 family serine peptidase [Synechococcales cyanobacterium M58_A2018_015]|nr:S8 family serine peptidase [Synechococcales cyanobacterium M58_A2018_015]